MALVHRAELAFSGADAEWDYFKNKGVGRHPPEFRLLANPSVQFYLLSSLWIMRVGSRLDAMLHDSCHGNRLRRQPLRGAIRANLQAYSSFTHFAYAYEGWRDSCLLAARRLLGRFPVVSILTFDLKNYFPSVNVSVLRNHISRQLSDPDDRTINTALFDCIDQFNLTNLTTGLPIGLPASNVLANTAISELDDRLRRLPGVHHYGRYVDDFALVVSDSAVTDPETAFDYLHKLAPTVFLRSPATSGSTNLLWATIATTKPAATFGASTSKVKLIHLEGKSGERLIDTIKENGALVASEWRFLPTHTSHSRSSISKLISIARGVNESDSVKLRETDGASIRKLGFALGLRQLELLSAHVEPGSLRPSIEGFAQVALEHVVSALNAGDYCVYWKRLLRLLLAAGTDKHVEQLFQRVGAALARLGVTPSDRFAEFVRDALCEAILGAPVSSGVRAGAMDILETTLGSPVPVGRSIDEIATGLFWADLAGTRLIDGILQQTYPRHNALAKSRIRRVPLVCSQGLATVARDAVQRFTDLSHEMTSTQLARRIARVGLSC